MGYLPIENYGVIGDLHTVALVGCNGSIDWFCYPHFDSPSIFGAILDDQKGGRFLITPAREDVTYRQLYEPDTNILIYAVSFCRRCEPSRGLYASGDWRGGLPRTSDTHYKSGTRIHASKGRVPPGF